MVLEYYSSDQLLSDPGAVILSDHPPPTLGVFTAILPAASWSWHSYPIWPSTAWSLSITSDQLLLILAQLSYHTIHSWSLSIIHKTSFSWSWRSYPIWQSTAWSLSIIHQTSCSLILAHLILSDHPPPTLGVITAILPAALWSWHSYPIWPPIDDTWSNYHFLAINSLILESPEKTTPSFLISFWPTEEGQ
jgi:hypothetical protein